MTYQPVKQDINYTADTKEVELGDSSETDVEGGNVSENASLFSRDEDRSAHGGNNKNMSLYKRALQANVPVIVSLHLLVFNAVLALALGSLLFKFNAKSEEGSGKAEAEFAPGELLYSESYVAGFVV